MNKIIRLNKFISKCGICSRRKADNLIKSGIIKVNNNIITTLGYKININDNVKYNNKLLNIKNNIYLLFNKPKNCITTLKDNYNRNIIMNYIPKIYKNFGLFPVGRLDINTTGLLLITNDGKLSKFLTHPRYKIKKKYKIYLNKNFNIKHLKILKKGIIFKEGKIIIKNLKIFKNNKKILIITIYIGWNRIIHRIFNKLGYNILNLNRIYFAGLKLNKSLKLGKYIILNKKKINYIKHINNINYNNEK
ncbi:MAG: hypothetical protein RDO_1460 [Flavobacteriales endosymbiont of Rhyzopertha dominica]|nr:MAG: pseudouridine synthase [Candidatus Shikimatogenerans bostrichidophilus]